MPRSCAFAGWPQYDQRHDPPEQVTRILLAICERWLWRTVVSKMAEWIRNGYNNVYGRRPRIKAIVWHDSNQPDIDHGHPDWRLLKPSGGSAVAAYPALAQNRSTRAVSRRGSRSSKPAVSAGMDADPERWGPPSPGAGTR